MSDSRIKFVGSLYDDKILRQIRENCYAYIHGHSKGGTNPSLLEALSITDINILYDVSYNREVGMDAALYFNKNNNSLKNALLDAEKLTNVEKKELGIKARKRIEDDYTWNIVVLQYKNFFEKLN